MALEIRPFREDWIDEAGTLLAARHRQDRIARPELPARFEDEANAAAAVRATWKRDHTTGAAAFDNGRLVAYLIGSLNLDPIWDRSAWIRLPGLALAAGQSYEILRHLYAQIGYDWVRQGCFAHFAFVPTADPALLQTWYSLSFGIEQVHGLLNLDTYVAPSPEPLPPGFELRRAGSGDEAALADISDVIWRHQTQAPVWSIALPEREADTQAGWAELASDPNATVWLALRAGQIASMQGYWKAAADDQNMLVDDQTMQLSVAGTRPVYRGQGLSRALTRHGLTQARQDGFHVCETDWRSTNLLSSRFWPQQGFQSAAYRLVRRIDPRIAWAHGSIR